MLAAVSVLRGVRCARHIKAGPVATEHHQAPLTDIQPILVYTALTNLSNAHDVMVRGEG